MAIRASGHKIQNGCRTTSCLKYDPFHLCRELKDTGYGSIRDFRNAYFEMRRKLELNALETERIILRENALLLHHFEDYLRIANIGVEHPLGLGFFSEQVLELPSKS